MLVQTTRKLLETQGLRSTTAFNAHFNALSKRENSPTPEAILHWIQEQDCGRRDYLARCDTAIKFIEAGLQGLRREDVLRLRQRSRYRATSVADRLLASDDASLSHSKKPGTRPGLNRVVWDLRHRGPVKLDPALMTRRNKPLAEDAEDIPGPAVVPGRYRVVLEAAGQRLEAGFAVVKDPRVKTSQRAFEQQGALLRQLYARWSSLNEGVNRIRLLKRQLRELERRLGAGDQPLAERGKSMVLALEAIEGVLVDIHRESSRDVLRHRAGLNDTLSDLISVVAIADEPPTQQAREVSQEAMAKVDAELARLDALVAGEIAALDAALRQAGIEVVGPARG
jgi:hypothetical protein